MGSVDYDQYGEPHKLKHDSLKNFSTQERYNISVLLKDQYSSSRADHAPGSVDPLNSLNVDYLDRTLTKQTRMEA